MALDALIFDVDGTLVDTNGLHVRAWVDAFASRGYRIAADRIAVEIGKGGDKLVPSILGREADARDGEALRDAQKTGYERLVASERVRVYPGAEELLERARERGLRTALATSSGGDHLDATFRSAGTDFRRMVDVVVTRDDIEASKPAPDLVEAALAKLGLAPTQCAMVGDTRWDAVACRRAGVVLLGLLTGPGGEEELRGAGARGVWRDPAHLLEELDRALERASPGAGSLGWARLESLMDEALAEARAGMDEGNDAPIGAVLARGDGTVLARGHNRLHSGRDRIAHAEIEALAAAAGAVPSGARDLVLVTTLEPCVMCTGAAMEAAVDTVVFGLRAPPDAGSDRVRAPSSPESQMPRIVGPLRAERSRALLEEWLARGGNVDQRAYVEQVLTSRESRA
jgi:HAD superfamily hydrolase (TIGR01509 family)